MITYKKEKIMKMEEFSGRADLLSVLLEDGKSYTKKEVRAILNGWLGIKEAK